MGRLFVAMLVVALAATAGADSEEERAPAKAFDLDQDNFESVTEQVRPRRTVCLRLARPDSLTAAHAAVVNAARQREQ